MRDSVLTDTSQAITAAVAEHVRALRHARGWSLDELSGRSRVSKGMVVQIEGARTNPSVGTLCRLADAFGVTVARLLEPAVERTVRITDATDAPELWQGGYGGSGRLLGAVHDLRGPGTRSTTVDPESGGAGVELWDWWLGPGDQHTSTEHGHGTREMLHVLVGSVTVTVDDDAYEVHTGQTMEFRADRVHAYRNDGASAARLMMVVVLVP